MTRAEEKSKIENIWRVSSDAKASMSKNMIPRYVQRFYDSHTGCKSHKIPSQIIYGTSIYKQKPLSFTTKTCIFSIGLEMDLEASASELFKSKLT